MRDYIITVDEDTAELMHYGVVGMHWHHRKAIAYAAKGNMKKAQKHLDKNIANNKKHNGFFYKRLEKVSSQDIEKYKKGRRKSALIGLGTAAVGATAVGYGAYRYAKNSATKKQGMTNKPASMHEVNNRSSVGIKTSNVNSKYYRQADNRSEKQRWKLADEDLRLMKGDSYTHVNGHVADDYERNWKRVTYNNMTKSSQRNRPTSNQTVGARDRVNKKNGGNRNARLHSNH